MNAIHPVMAAALAPWSLADYGGLVTEAPPAQGQPCEQFGDSQPVYLNENQTLRERLGFVLIENASLKEEREVLLLENKLLKDRYEALVNADEGMFRR